MAVLGIDHIELIVRDVDEFVEFYEKLGFEVLMRTSHHGGSAELKLPGENQPVFEIHTVSGEENIGVNHIAFKVDSAQGIHEEMLQKGLTPRGPRITWLRLGERTSICEIRTAGGCRWWTRTGRLRHRYLPRIASVFLVAFTKSRRCR